MEMMTRRLVAAAVVAGMAVLGADCTASTPAPAGGPPSSAAAASPGLPNPFTIVARHSVKSLGLDHPDALAVGPDGNLYVIDLSQRVTVISPGGKVLRRWGRPGTGPSDAVSGGALRIRVINQWGDWAPDAEAQVVRAVGAGTVDPASEPPQLLLRLRELVFGPGDALVRGRGGGTQAAALRPQTGSTALEVAHARAITRSATCLDRLLRPGHGTS